MDDIDYGALFGMEEPTPTGETEAEPAAPQEEAQEPEEAQSATEPEAADPAAVDSEKQSDEDNDRFAAARRKAEAERDRAIAQAKEEAQAEAKRTIDQFFAASGLLDPYTQKPITTKAEYDAYRARYDQEQRATMMQKTGMSAEDMQRFISGLPEVRAAREAKQAADEAAQRAREQTARAKVEEQLREIQTIAPEVKTLGDLAKTTTYPKLYEMVQKGYSIADAYKLANYDLITARAAAASKQAALNAAQAKQHLSATKTRGGGGAEVPKDIMDAYKLLNPKATAEEIQRHYQKYIDRKE